MPMIVRSVNVPDPAAVAPFRLVPAEGPVEIGPQGFAAAGEHAWTHQLYAYPTAHHPFWRTVRAQARVARPEDPILPGMFDEHLSLEGVQESQLWLGDVLRLPGCELVVAAPRLPDARFDETLGFPHAAKMVRQSRWCGVWLGVRRPGRIAAGDPFDIVPGPRELELVELFRSRLARQPRGRSGG
jgi:MOSC domain-containing protein YiiM